MSIGTITGTGKQSVAVAGVLKYKKIQKGTMSFCFLADDTVVDFDSLVSFILEHGGSTITELNSGSRYRRKTCIPCASGILTKSYQDVFSVLMVSQERQYDSIPWYLVDVKAVGVSNSSSSAYTTQIIDNTWVVV